MTDVVKYVFKIKGEYSLNTLPMERLAEYMAELARMLGEPNKVHFVELVESSIGIVHAVERDTSEIIDARIDDIQRGTAPIANMAAYRALNKKLKEDKSFGELAPLGGAKLLPFPGKDAPEPVTLSGVMESGSIDGMIIRVGGKREEIPVAIQSGDVVYGKCVATKPLAKELAKFLFEGELRLFGQGRWSRNEDGVWALQKFHISRFEKLDDAPLDSVIADLRSIPHEQWGDAEDYWEEAMDLRNGGDRH